MRNAARHAARSKPAATLAAASVAPSASLELRRVVAAPRDRVFDAWTDAALIPEWFKPGAVPLRSVELQLRAGGAWRMVMDGPGGRALTGGGVFLEVDRPRRIVYTWNWEPDVIGRETIVTVEFHERDGGTEIVLRHDGFPTPRPVPGHRAGWTACLDAMSILISRTEAST